jgi:DNA mismatch endonuclease (patch repair protein)
VAFTKAKVAVFIDGCFWHGCPDHGVSPRTNSDYWSAKIARNRARDLENDRALIDQGWLVIRIWEHDDPEEAASLVEDAVRSRHCGHVVSRD